MDKTDTLVKTDPSGLMYVTVSSLGLREDITPDVVMGCEVTIPDTQFYIREELELFHYPSKRFFYYTIRRKIIFMRGQLLQVGKTF